MSNASPAARVAINRRYYDKTRRATHIGPLAPLCRQRGPVVASGATCKTCLRIEKARQVGKRLNEWERKRLDALFRQQAAEKTAAWRRRNPEKARAACRRWRARNVDVHRIARREWGARNRERLTATQRERRASKRSRS